MGRRCGGGSRLVAERIYAARSSDFPEPVAKFHAAAVTTERSLEKQHPGQVRPVKTRPTDSAEPAPWTRHHLNSMRRNRDGYKSVILAGQLQVVQYMRHGAINVLDQAVVLCEHR